MKVKPLPKPTIDALLRAANNALRVANERNLELEGQLRDSRRWVADLQDQVTRLKNTLRAEQ